MAPIDTADDLEDFGNALRTAGQIGQQLAPAFAQGAVSGAPFGPYGAVIGGLANVGMAAAGMAAGQGRRTRTTTAAPRPPGPPPAPPPLPGSPVSVAPAAAPPAMPAPGVDLSNLPPELLAQLLRLALSGLAGPSPAAGAARPSIARSPSAPVPPAGSGEGEEEADTPLEWLVRSGLCESLPDPGPPQRALHEDEPPPLSPLPPLSPARGGRSIGEDLLEPGDIILSTAGLSSLPIRLATASPVSHTGLYVGGGRVVEAIPPSVLEQPLRTALSDDTVAVAFRDQRATDQQRRAIVAFARAQRGRRFDYLGIFAQAVFRLRGSRRPVGVYLGTDHDDRFFCTELVLEAYEHAGLPLLLTPRGDLAPGALARLHPLVYVGHLKAT